MLSSKVTRCLKRLVALHKNEAVSEDWFVSQFDQQLGGLLTADNADEVLDFLRPEMTDAILQAVQIDHMATADYECLWPERSPLTLSESSNRHLRECEKRLLEPLDNESEYQLCVICYPAFGCEWSMRLLDGVGSDRTMSLRVSVHGELSDGSMGTTGVISKEANLPSKLAKLVTAAWQKMTRGTRYPKFGGEGRDGVSYQFACLSPNKQWMCGTTWSPDPETAPGKLVTLSHLLRDYVESSGTARDEVVNAIQSTGQWLVEWR